jgi:hypothetical protein
MEGKLMAKVSDLLGGNLRSVNNILLDTLGREILTKNTTVIYDGYLTKNNMGSGSYNWTDYKDIKIPYGATKALINVVAILQRNQTYGWHELCATYDGNERIIWGTDDNSQRDNCSGDIIYDVDKSTWGNTIQVRGGTYTYGNDNTSDASIIETVKITFI